MSNPFEQPGPTHTRTSVRSACPHAMKANQMVPWTRDQRGEPFNALIRSACARWGELIRKKNITVHRALVEHVVIQD
jgi:hypothetical protein